ncbi:acyl-CoA dehydrogenase [Rhodothermaceae bacterium RA]|nr:acyl-CoA dehydrogenase [Rhodothermaceae bacterium RA]
MSVASYPSGVVWNRVDFPSFLDAYRRKLREAFNVRAEVDRFSVQRGIPPLVMREVQACTPLSVFIPEAYDGRGGHIHEGLAMLAASSYESLALSLTMGINGALFLQPLARYGEESVKAEVFRRFLQEKNLGGLMITEPEFGSDALSMQTSYTEEPGGYRIVGTKHWAGLTGWADFWLLTARARGEDGQLGRDIDFFVCDVSQPEQHIEVTEYFQNLGLYMIPYGVNKIDVLVPHTHRLQPETTGIKMMLDILHRSRIQFPGMAMGFLQRLLDEGLQHCRERSVGGQSLLHYDQVKKRLGRIQAFYTACSAMCTYTSEHAGLDRDLAKENVPANSIKTVVTDMMQEASQSLLQLFGAKGYRLDSIAGRAVVDSRPFQIFEGSNDILYQQISEAVLKQMRRLKESNLYRYLRQDNLTQRAADYFRDALDFEVDLKLPQRKLVELGRLLGRVVSMDMVVDLGGRGFRGDLIANCLAELKQDVENLVSSYRNMHLADVIEEYLEDSFWLEYTTRPAT